MYDRLAEKYVLDKDVSEWIMDANPYAMHEMIDVLMEARSSGMWDASENILEGLGRVYAECEGLLEGITDKGR